MSRFRPIQPMGDQDRLLSTAEDNGLEQPTKKRQRTNVIQACHSCRRSKIKCDGIRPKCEQCTTKDKLECTYDGEEGQSRPAAMKSRVESLEKLVHQLQSEQSSNESANTALSQSSGYLPPLSIQLTIPRASVAQPALDGFFSCSGKLFHVFSRVQISQLSKYAFQDLPQFSCDQKTSICCVMAVAAVGAQYAQDERYREYEGIFYSLAQHYFDDVLETRPMDAIKVCALLTLYNVFKKATVSLAYVDIGLGMCRRFGLDCKKRQLHTLTDSMWSDYRKTWRTLIFISTWLSFTLGYKSGCEEFMERISPYQLEIGDSSDVSETVQTEMAKISILKAQILRMHLAFKDLTLPTIQSIVQELQHWYDGMPPVMHLNSLGQEDIPIELKRSICHVHLLYLGANMLLFRRIASQFVKSSVKGFGRDVLWTPCEEMLTDQCARALSAANSSARIVKLLLDENGVFKRCWLIIFQSYTSCVIILHAVSQKQATSTDPSIWEEDLENAKLCLNALAYCGSLDPVASKFHDRLLSIYESLLNPLQSVANKATEEQSLEQVHQVASRQDLSCTIQDRPPSPLPRPKRSPTQVSFDLLELLCRPFGDLSNRDMSKESLAYEDRYDPTRYEHPQLIERMDWAFEDKAAFEWNQRDIGINLNATGVLGNAATSVSSPLGPGHRFLDSTNPSGWASPEALRVTKD
ncbi:hypothetical protein F4776DRAFT_649935 [Hypoxylon sp. NC0597]|nr:hypothetical protein F4776DRAFT_649935 [Hypoxylon sp. NC0597]